MRWVCDRETADNDGETQKECEIRFSFRMYSTILGHHHFSTCSTEIRLAIYSNIYYFHSVNWLEHNVRDLGFGESLSQTERKKKPSQFNAEEERNVGNKTEKEKEAREATREKKK